LFPMMVGERLRAFRLEGGDYLTREPAWSRAGRF
jgi:hypothetical protein